MTIAREPKAPSLVRGSFPFCRAGWRRRMRLHVPFLTWLAEDLRVCEVVHAQPNMGFGVRLSDLSELQRETMAELLNYALSTSDRPNPAGP